MTVIGGPGIVLRILRVLLLNLSSTPVKCGYCYSSVTDEDAGLW